MLPAVHAVQSNHDTFCLCLRVSVLVCKCIIHMYSRVSGVRRTESGATVTAEVTADK